MNNKKQRKTAGAIATELLMNPEQNHVEDVRAESFKNLEETIKQTFETTKQHYPNDYYIVVLTLKDPIIPNQYRNRVFDRASCPTPTNDQIVYKVHRKSEELEFLWVIPDVDTCRDYLQHKTEVPLSHADLFKFISDYASGELDKLCNRLNGEEFDSNILVQ